MTESLPSPHVAAIIPAFNEATQIGLVLQVLRQIPDLDQIILVDDGSTDSTLSVMQAASQTDPRIQVIHNDTNRGKGEAVYSARQEVQAQYLLLVDADLLGLQPHHVLDLMRPVLTSQADMTVGIFKGGKLNTDFSHFITPWISGQRFLQARLLDQINWRAASGYGLESAITIAARKQGWRCRYIPWRGVYHPPSEFHRGIWKGTINRVRMYSHILRAWLSS